MRAWYRANLEAQRERSRQKEKRDRAKTLARRKKRRQAPGGDAAERRRNHRHRLKRIYKITVEKYDALRAAHGDLCAVCRQPETRKKNGRVKTLALDHDHATGEVRGFLCHRCNTGLGAFKDRPELLAAAIEYLNGTLRFRPGPR